MGSRQIKKELLRAFPMFYFRVKRRRSEPGYWVDVVKGPVDFRQGKIPHGGGNARIVLQAEGTADSRESDIYTYLSVTPIGAKLLELMVSSVLPLAEQISLSLGTTNQHRYIPYEVTNESDCTVLISYSEYSKSYRGYEFERMYKFDNLWHLYHDGKRVLYNNELAHSEGQRVGESISFANIREVTDFIDELCGTPHDPKCATVGKMIALRHLYQLSKYQEMQYRGITIVLESYGMYAAYNSTGEVVYSTGSLNKVLVGIDNHLKEE